MKFRGCLFIFILVFTSSVFASDRTDQIDSAIQGVIGAVFISLLLFVVPWLFKKIISGTKSATKKASKVAKSASFKVAKSTSTFVQKTTRLKEAKILDIDDEVFEIANDEIESNNQKRGLWAKAFAISEGDERKQKAVYLRLRVEQLTETPDFSEDGCTKPESVHVDEESDLILSDNVQKSKHSEPESRKSDEPDRPPTIEYVKMHRAAIEADLARWRDGNKSSRTSIVEEAKRNHSDNSPIMKHLSSQVNDLGYEKNCEDKAKNRSKKPGNGGLVILGVLGIATIFWVMSLPPSKSNHLNENQTDQSPEVVTSRLEYPDSIGNMSATFNNRPQRRSTLTSPNEAANALVSFSGNLENALMHGIAIINRTDNYTVKSLGYNYPKRVATGIRGTGVQYVKVRLQTEEIDHAMEFTLDLVNKHGIPGTGLYVARVDDGKTYQAFTICYGKMSSSCSSYHDDFLETVKY